MQNQIDKKKEKYFGNEENIFPQVEKLNYEEAKFRLQQKLTTYGKFESKIQNINTLNYGNPQSLKHFVAKAVLVHTLINKEQHCSTEILDADVYWINRDTAIEIEKNYTPKNVEEKINKFKKIFQEIHIINLNELSNDFVVMEQDFINKLGL